MDGRLQRETAAETEQREAARQRQPGGREPLFLKTVILFWCVSFPVFIVIVFLKKGWDDATADSAGPHGVRPRGRAGAARPGDAKGPGRAMVGIPTTKPDPSPSLFSLSLPPVFNFNFGRSISFPDRQLDGLLGARPATRAPADTPAVDLRTVLTRIQARGEKGVRRGRQRGRRDT